MKEGRRGGGEEGSRGTLFCFLETGLFIAGTRFCDKALQGYFVANYSFASFLCLAQYNIVLYSFLWLTVIISLAI